MPPFKTPPPTKSPSTPNTEGLYYSTRYTNLDIEDNEPMNTGETMNGFKQINTSDNPYMNDDGTINTTRD